MTNKQRSVDQDVALLTEQCEFGDDGLAAAMRAQLRSRIVEARGSDRSLRVYVGFDPTAPDLHLGHAVQLRALRRFQDLGHDATVVVGTMTALVGDTSDRATGRPRRDAREVRAAAETYAEQVFAVLRRDVTTVAYNADWLSSLTLNDLIEAASAFTVQQFLQRESYRLRLDRGDPVGLHEFFYALMQAYDAVHLRCDVQIGGTDQLFNLRASARLQETMGQVPCVTLTYPLLVGTDGAEKMSKSLGNSIGITESPQEQFGKVMSVSDETMLAWAQLATDWVAEDAAEFCDAVASGALHPMEAKKRLAHRVVALYYGDHAADAAQRAFEDVHQRGRAPATVPERQVAVGTALVDVLVDAGLARSRSAARRLIEGRGVSLDDERVDDPGATLIRDGLVRVGPRRFVRVRVVR